jgi:hypothetical protein
MSAGSKMAALKGNRLVIFWTAVAVVFLAASYKMLLGFNPRIGNQRARPWSEGVHSRDESIQAPNIYKSCPTEYCYPFYIEG